MRNRMRTEQAHAADAPTDALKVVRFLTITSTKLSKWHSQGRG
jgi:hypothetical protein